VTNIKSIQKGARVVCKEMPNGPRGEVLRVAHDRSWCDVKWLGKILGDGPCEVWIKRMNPEALTVFA
jgi:hypothetical protein